MYPVMRGWACITERGCANITERKRQTPHFNCCGDGSAFNFSSSLVPPHHLNHHHPLHHLHHQPLFYFHHPLHHLHIGSPPPGPGMFVPPPHTHTHTHTPWNHPHACSGLLTSALQRLPPSPHPLALKICLALRLFFLALRCFFFFKAEASTKRRPNGLVFNEKQTKHSVL